MAQKEFSTDPLQPGELAEVREFLAVRRWWKAFWAKLADLAAKLKLISSLAPWVLGLALIYSDRVREFFGW